MKNLVHNLNIVTHEIQTKIVPEELFLVASPERKDIYYVPFTNVFSSKISKT